MPKNKPKLSKPNGKAVPFYDQQVQLEVSDDARSVIEELCEILNITNAEAFQLVFIAGLESVIKHCGIPMPKRRSRRKVKKNRGKKRRRA